MTDEQALAKELAARKMAHGCPVYAPGKVENDTLYKATLSGQTSAACGRRWFDARDILKKRGLTPLQMDPKTNG